MLPSELPIEILSQIAEHLSKKDKALCALACKRWKVPFQESFWKNISAQSIEELCEICTIPKDSLHENPYALVKSLAVGGKSTFTAWLECGIFQIFSSLTHLDVRCLHIQTVDVYDANRSDSFRSLKEMEQQKVISFISQFPNLEEVNIYSYDGQRILTFTTSDIDTIHNNLPHLKSVKGRFSLDDIDQDTIDNLQNTIPALSVTSLDLIITKKDCIWCRYLELIKLTRLQICGIISEETKGVSIDMPYTKTQKLIFDRVQFYSSTEHLNERTKINLILMSQLTEASQSDENEETAGVESSMSYICWLHRFKETENVNNFTQWYRELSDQDCQEILAYYHKSSYKKKNIGTQEVRKGFGRKTTKKFWEDDLGRGYVEWVCSPLVDNNDSLSRLKDSNFYNVFFWSL
ncbi:hypothetical protein PHYBLDRAFT_169675 [Phycomyces blakesleeanus NRRL 1555(-)]|uniref:F-box domain-containing protein n=1 Tax=Phycomyces blakesleeanus (strain ATCC 8743b / DSM 1359 / FGSC 10004 / NBRC 33097 / NRRL 1555) TaxID=763407 RepID=A0A167MDM0_PHYB8|nr:hypothetical protein PHYBLDRAFT_169675 [Phycomyces blakesleeanus NRRL 1555(-)]OAD72547.1 hypothetical protein PHYBLDRAFT_169675 [Phycomyces blakesleeanus NRRL 1555(-)]|eukprot:XP_018290587.1 hypothetical protein PHYBLDRAFT_169675 [Phycomyces blakesleeanus NRRL 1555(-)]